LPPCGPLGPAGWCPSPPERAPGGAPMGEGGFPPLLPRPLLPWEPFPPPPERVLGGPFPPPPVEAPHSTLAETDPSPWILGLFFFPITPRSPEPWWSWSRNWAASRIIRDCVRLRRSRRWRAGERSVAERRKRCVDNASIARGRCLGWPQTKHKTAKCNVLPEPHLSGEPLGSPPGGSPPRIPPRGLPRGPPGGPQTGTGTRQ
jgi:hypothetical protein